MWGEVVDMFTLVLFTVHTNNVVSYRGIVRCAGIAAVRHGGDWRKLTVEEIAWAVRPLGEIGGIGRAAMIAAMVQRTSASLYEMSYDEIMELAGISEKVGGCAVSYWRPERWSEVERERERWLIAKVIARMIRRGEKLDPVHVLRVLYQPSYRDLIRLASMYLSRSVAMLSVMHTRPR